jgi:hypothetical protein
MLALVYIILLLVSFTNSQLSSNCLSAIHSTRLPNLHCLHVEFLTSIHSYTDQLAHLLPTYHLNSAIPLVQI